MTIQFQDKYGCFIKKWPNVEYTENGIPSAGDVVVLHWGDYGEDTERWKILFRIFDGMLTDRIFVVIEKE